MQASLQILDQLSFTLCGSHQKERHHLQRERIVHTGRRQNEMIPGQKNLLNRRIPAVSQVWKDRKKPVWSLNMAEWMIVQEIPLLCGAVWSWTWTVVAHKKVRVLDMVSFSVLCRRHLTFWIWIFKALGSIARRRTSPTTQRLCVCTETPWSWSCCGSNRPLTAGRRYKNGHHYR